MRFKVRNLAKAALTSAFQGAKLQQIEIASRLLPADTRFAVVIDAVHKLLGESFYETDTIVMPGQFGISHGPEGIQGRFLGYLTMTDTKIKIFQSLDTFAEATGQDNPAPIITPDASVQNSGLTLILEDDIANLTLSMLQGETVITFQSMAIKVTNFFPIYHAQNVFETIDENSQNPQKMVSYMGSHGANIDQYTITAKKFARNFIVIFIATLVGLAAFFILIIFLNHGSRFSQPETQRGAVFQYINN